MTSCDLGGLCTDRREIRPDRGIHVCRGFGVSHAFQSDEQNYRPLLLRQVGETAFQVAKLKPRSLIGRDDQTRVRFLQLEMIALPRISANAADVSAIQNCE
jgi:hypothetical protein